jgi:hypothetical protein
MNLLSRLLLYLLLVLGVARAILYCVYAADMLPLPLESHNLESKSVLLAYRAAHGLSLYPAWWDYPYVSNWFGPVNALVVGLLGRVLDGEFRGLFLVGRTVSFASSLLTTLVLAVAIGRRWGRGAGLAGGVLSLGSGPMFGFTVMVRPDALAELLGVGGFLLSDGRSGRARAAGIALLVLAILTKQTAAVFLLAAALATGLAGEKRRGLAILGAAAALLIGVVAVVTVVREPHFARSLVGERVMPWSFDTWLTAFRRIIVSCPDVLVLPVIGLWLWLGDPSQPRAVRPATLVVVLLASSLVLSLKLGADINYYLSLRVAEALAVGALWHAVHSTATDRQPRLRSILLTAMTLSATALVVPSVLMGTMYVDLANGESVFYETPNGRTFLRSYREAIALAEDPRVHMLTDVGLLDVHQGQRAAFGDPWLFRTLVETDRLHPTKMAEQIDSQYYDVFITAHDLNSPRYLSHDFRLPKGLIERVRANYVYRESPRGLQFYVPRKGGR